MQATREAQPLKSLDEWEDSLVERYPTPASKLVGTNPNKTKEQFRNYEANARPSVREFYRLNHTHQTYDFVQAKKKEFLSRSRKQMSIWEAMEFLNTLIDDSDPDTDMTQLEHLLQTAEQIRKDGHPRWFILTGLIHDLGKILCLYGEPLRNPFRHRNAHSVPDHSPPLTGTPRFFVGQIGPAGFEAL